MNYLLTMAFNGSAYHGFQVQKNALAVCTVLQDAMQNVFGARPDVKGCSRTDAGVHARQFCVSFCHDTNIPTEKIPLALNSHLPQDVRVTSARRVPDSFHARYSATGKEYQYVILNSQADDPLAPGLYYRMPHPMDIDAMNQAAQFLVGKHDFASFMSSGSTIEDTVRTISYLSVERKEDRVIITIAADGFLYNMVRIIAGTLLRVGLGKLATEKISTIIEGKDRALAGETLPAKGLFLTKVFYPQEALEKE